MATIEKYQTRSGATLYRVRYRKPDRKQTQKRGFGTKREAEMFAASVEVAKARGEYVAPSVGRTTIGELGPAWLARQRGHLKPSSIASQESSWRTHVKPRWAATRIGDIRHSDVQAWAAELSSRRGADCVRAAVRVLRGVLDDAERDRLLASNPARGVKLPKRSPTRHIYLTSHQLDMLADECDRYGYGSLVLLLGVGGLRWGEAAALRVSDVDFLRRRIELHTNAVTVNGKVHVGTLKGGKARTVVVPPFVTDALARTAAAKARNDLLWTGRDGEHLSPPHGDQCWLSAALRRCQKSDPAFPSLTAHDLRHTAASLAVHVGANVKVLQRMLGHTSAAMTLDVYADLFESDLDAVAENVAKMWPTQAEAR